MRFAVLARIDHRVITLFRRCSDPLARFALFSIYAWFGALKIVDLSPASEMVQTMHVHTLGFLIPFGTFMVVFGALEVCIGALFLIRGAERPAVVLMLGHMLTTTLPLIVLPSMAWTGFLVPTMEGQYIIKNIALIALAIGIASRLEPSRR